MNKIIVLVGRSGVGKGTILTELTTKEKYNYLKLKLVRKVTTRELRPTEDEKMIINLSKEKMEEMITNDEIICAAKASNGDLYGILKSEVENILKLNQVPIFEINFQIEQLYNDLQGLSVTSIAIEQNNPQVIKNFLVNRGTEQSSDLTRRVNTSEGILFYMSHFSDFNIKNDETIQGLVEKTVSIIEQALEITQAKKKPLWEDDFDTMIKNNDLVSAF